jgi:hypothetical protein
VLEEATIAIVMRYYVLEGLRKLTEILISISGRWSEIPTQDPPKKWPQYFVPIADAQHKLDDLLTFSNIEE